MVYTTHPSLTSLFDVEQSLLFVFLSLSTIAGALLSAPPPRDPQLLVCLALAVPPVVAGWLAICAFLLSEGHAAGLACALLPDPEVSFVGLGPAPP